MTDVKCKPTKALPKPRPKPCMRGMHMAKTIHNVKMACGCSLASAVLFYIFNNRPRRNRYADFYAAYDPMKSFERMSAAGVLSAAPPEGDGDDKGKKK